jgi:4-amino-4-deoxy-L-arabinose transferase-like glycosyltransferase
MVEEPSVLDFLKSKLMPWKGVRVDIPPAEVTSEIIEETLVEAEFSADVPKETGDIQSIETGASLDTSPVKARGALARSKPHLPWRMLLALVLALIAQLSLEPRPNRSWGIGAALYVVAAIFLVWGVLKETGGRFEPDEVARDTHELHSEKFDSAPFRIRPYALLLALPFILLAYVTFGGNLFTKTNIVLWLVALGLVILAFWQRSGKVQSWITRLWAFIKRPEWKLKVTPWMLLILAALALSVFFRFYRLSQVPPEMVSDHAEKLLDIYDVMHGKPGIFFPRNTGREAFQMYLTAAMILLFKQGYSFLSLKLGTVLLGMFTLPFIYLLGKEMGSRRAGLLAMVFAGIAYWPNVISRIALRFTLYPFFYGPALYFLVHGLRTRQRNDFILSGIFLGIGLHGYSPYRIVPVVLVIAIILYLLHPQSLGWRKQAIYGFIILALVSLVVFLPLLRYIQSNPEMFNYRAMTRIGSVERPLPGPAWQIFLSNIWNALTMFAWDDGEVWVISVTHRPVLDIVSAALFHLGVVLLLVRYLRKRNWLDIFTLISIPLLMMPSILSLAFPAENPSLNRTAAALVPVFLLIGIALDWLLSALEKGLGGSFGKNTAWAMGIFLLLLASWQNYDLVFNQYQRAYELSSWNTSELGKVIQSFGDLYGSTDTAYVVGYPYWVDSRLVAMNAGVPTRDFAIWPDQFADTLNDFRPKMFLVNPEDQADLELLRQLFPQGNLSTYESQVGKDFYIYTVPPASNIPSTIPTVSGTSSP